MDNPLSYFDLLSFEYCAMLFGSCSLAVLTCGLLSVLGKGGRVRGGYALAGGVGSVLGFLFATAPYVHVSVETWYVAWSGGGAYYSWPPFWLPVEVEWPSPFVSGACGTMFGFGAGCIGFDILLKRKNATKDDPERGE